MFWIYTKLLVKSTHKNIFGKLNCRVWEFLKLNFHVCRGTNFFFWGINSYSMRIFKLQLSFKKILDLKEPRAVQLLNQHVRKPNGRCDFQLDSIWSTVCCDLNVAGAADFLFIWYFCIWNEIACVWNKCGLFEEKFQMGNSKGGNFLMVGTRERWKTCLTACSLSEIVNFKLKNILWIF